MFTYPVNHWHESQHDKSNMWGRCIGGNVTQEMSGSLCRRGQGGCEKSMFRNRESTTGHGASDTPSAATAMAGLPRETNKWLQPRFPTVMLAKQADQLCCILTG